MIEAYPLCWPVGYPRSKQTSDSRFERHTLSQATKKVITEIGRFGDKNPIISTNMPLRKDGMPRADYLKRSISDYGVAVYFKYKEKQVVLACDRWTSIEDNLWSIALSIEAMRGLERWGVSDILDRTFTGFKALPEGPTPHSCWDVLNMPATKNADTVRRQYLDLAKTKHPDGGGTKEDFHQLQEAYKEAIKFCEQ